MICQSCQAENAADSVYCDECGCALEAACPGCGAGNRPGAKFCRKCRASLTGVLSPEPVERAPRLADKILRSRASLEGERKQVTVLFADVKGSMNLAESMDPEAWSGIMQGFFRRMVDGVEQFEGYVDKFTGDGIMALFGAPLAHEDHAQRACFAALKLRDAAREYAGEVRSRHGVPFEVRIGINSGEVVVGRIGDDSRMEFTAQGHTVGLAQRMEALAESGHISLSAHTARLVEGYFQLRGLGEVPVKGVANPVGMFELVGVGSLRSRIERGRIAGLSSFVGRDREFALLEAALDRARGEGGQVVGISAEAGTGKSRLCAEFLDSCRKRGIPVLEGRGVAHGKRIPMLPMLEMWRAFYGITESDGAEAARAKIAGRLLMMDEGFRDDLPILFDVFGIPDADNPSPTLDPEQRNRRVHGVCKRILHDPAYRGARVILLEDLHWFDGASDAFLETFVDSVPATRDLWILNFRPEYQARWMQRSWYQHVALQPLGADAIRSLLADHLGADASVGALPGLIQERTRGNPFYIEEIVQSLVEAGHLVGKRGAYRLTTPVASLEVPATVQALLASRIDRLAAREKDVLQTAAVIGKTFAESLLQHVLGNLAGILERALGDALQTLAAGEFLYETSLYPRVEFSFKHPLTQEVALRSQLSERRARVHAVVAEALESGGEGLDERSAEIAGHWIEAGDRAAAARWSMRAAKWSALTDVRESLHHWRRSRELAPAVEDAGERGEIAMQACDQILALNWRMGDSEEESAAVFAEGRALAAAAGDRKSEAMFVGRYGLTRMSVAGSAADYVRYGEESLELGTACGDPVLLAAVGTFAAFGHFHVGDGRPTIDRATRVLDITGSDNTIGKSLTGYSPRVGMLVCKARGLMCLGRLGEAGTVVRDAMAAAMESGEEEPLTWAYIVASEIAWAIGRAGRTLEYARRGLELAERLDNEASRVTSYTALAAGHLLDGDPMASRDAARESCRISMERRAQRSVMTQALTLVAESSLMLGDRDAALAASRESIDRGRNGGTLQWEARGHLILARALLATDHDVPLAEVESALDRADEIVDSIDARVLSPHILELRGRVAAVRGDTASATTLLRDALAFYGQIGAEGHSARLAAELGA